MVLKVKRWLAHVANAITRLTRSKRFWKITGIIAAIIIMLQFLFPYDRAFVFAEVDGRSVSLKTRSEIATELGSTYANAKVTTTNPDTSSSFREAGISPNNEATATRLVDYPLWQRAIPLSSVYKLVVHSHRSDITYQDLPLSQWAKKVSDVCKVDAKDASIAAADNGELVVVPSSQGAKCESSDITRNLKQTTLGAEMKVDPARKTVQPKRTDQQVSSQLSKIKTAVEQGITVSVLDTETKAEKAEIVSWLTFADGENGELKLDVDQAKMAEFIARVQAPVYIQPGVTSISLLDGTETSRSNGSAGRGIDATKLVEAVRSQLQTLKVATIEAQVTNLPPRENISRSYTNSTLGLQTLLDDLAAEKGDMAIAIQELGGQGRNLSANGGKQYHPASTYKLFIAYSVIKRIEAGQLKWEDQINGKSVDACVSTMIIDSDNACAEAFAEQFTWRTIQSEIRAIGMSGTDLNRAEPVSTVTDQVAFLKKFNDNQLMKPENKDKLLSLMKRQRFRAGVPAGVSYEVADKVGFLSGLLHDSAIVYGPNGGYIISVYSNGGSWSDIADVTRRINRLING